MNRKHDNSTGGGGSLESDARQAGEAAKQTIRQGAEQASDAAKNRAESMKDEATRQAHRTASALDSAADELAAEDQESLAAAVSGMARRLDQLAGQFEGKSIDELLRDAGRMAQRNPMLFLAGSIAVGVFLSRFFKAEPRQGGYGYDSSLRGYGYGSEQGYGLDEEYFDEYDRDLERDYTREDAAYSSAVHPAGQAGMDEYSLGQHTTPGSAHQEQPQEQRQHGAPLRAGETKPDEQSRDKQSRDKHERGG
jgi:hypothetical protein